MRHFWWNCTTFHLALKDHLLRRAATEHSTIYAESHRPGRNVFQGGFGSFEEYLSRSGGNIISTYVTILRHPIERVLSSYRYFCKSCAEEGRFCGDETTALRSEMPNCPNASVVEWAQFEGNVYVADFSLHSSCEASTRGVLPWQYFAARSRFVTPAEMYVALNMSAHTTRDRWGPFRVRTPVNWKYFHSSGT